MWSDFKIKKIKRRFGMNSTNNSAADHTAAVAEGDEPIVEEEVISRKSVGK